MRALVLNGNPDTGNRAFEVYLEHLARALTEAHHEVETLILRDMDIRHCSGCWGCWVKTPGECVTHDDEARVCRSAIGSDFVLFASPMIMGFPSALLKRVAERFLSLIHPYATIVQGEVHHRSRYGRYPLLGLLLEPEGGAEETDVAIVSEIFSRTALNFKSQLSFTGLTSTSVEAIARSIAGARPLPRWRAPDAPTSTVRDVPRYSGPAPTRLTVFNGSPRGKTGNTHLLLEQFVEGFEENPGQSHEMYYLKNAAGAGHAREAFEGAEQVLLGFPLYADSMPGMVKAFIESLEPFQGRGSNPSLAFLVQSGFPEAAHSRFVERYLEGLARRLGCRYAGTIVKGGGEVVRSLPPERNHALFEKLHRLGEAYALTGRLDPSLLEAIARPERFPRIAAPLLKLFTKSRLANDYWDSQLKKNNAFDRRFAQPYAS